VHGIKRRASSFATQRINHIFEDQHHSNVRLRLHYGDFSDATNLIRIIQEVRPQRSNFSDAP
jgi:GDPmannose 4,6-dehydratase